MGVRDGKDNIIPIGKTDPQRSIDPEQGEIIRVNIKSISKREDGNQVMYGLGSPMPVKSNFVAAKPSSINDIAKFYEQGKPQ